MSSRGGMVLGVDIGATRTKLGLVRLQDAQLVWRQIVPTPREATAEAFLAWLQRTIREALQGAVVEGIGIGIAGFVDPEGTLVHSPNMPQLQQLPLQRWLGEHFPFPVVVDNDANVAAWAEYRLGAAQDVSECLYVTVGTGVGGALILGGRLWRGVHGGAGEIGHVVVDLTASEHAGVPPFRIGVLEEYVGQAALLRCAQGMVARYPDSVLASRPITLEALAEAYGAGDEAARECLAWAAWVLGLGLVSALALVDVEVAVLGGGIVEAFPGFVPAVHATVRHRALPALANRVQLRSAQFGVWAGVLGAALLVGECPTSGDTHHA